MWSNILELRHAPTFTLCISPPTQQIELMKLWKIIQNLSWRWKSCRRTELPKVKSILRRMEDSPTFERRISRKASAGNAQDNQLLLGCFSSKMSFLERQLFWFCRDVLGNVEVMQLDFEMENFTSLSVTRRINWNIDYKGQSPQSDSEKVVTELTVVQRDIQAVIPLAMVSDKKIIIIKKVTFNPLYPQSQTKLPLFL